MSERDGVVTRKNYELLQEELRRLNQIIQDGNFTVQKRDANSQYYLDSRIGWLPIPTFNGIYCAGSASAIELQNNSLPNFPAFIKITPSS